MIDFNSIFPFATMRPAQRRALEFIYEAWDSGKETVVLELPTGVGKSPIAIAASRMMPFLPDPKPSIGDSGQPEDNTDVSSYILTTQKILQQQYITDFGVGSKHDCGLVSIKSKTNYPCEAYNGQRFCDAGYRLAKKIGNQKDDYGDPIPLSRYVKALPKKEQYDILRNICNGLIDRGYEHLPCKKAGQCEYATAIKAWLSNDISVTNTSFFFTARKFTKTRNLLVVDEVHLVDDELIGFYELKIENEFVFSNLSLPVPDFKDIGSAAKWCLKYLWPKLNDAKKTLEIMAEVDDDDESYRVKNAKIIKYDSIIKKMSGFINSVLEEYDSGSKGALAKEIYELKKSLSDDKLNEDDTRTTKAHLGDLTEVLNSIQLFTYEDGKKTFLRVINEDKWVMDKDDKGNQIIKPVYSGLFGSSHLLKYGKRHLFMSGTILDKDEFCKSLGLDKDKVAFFKEPSPFDPDNRIVVYSPVGSMSRKHVSQTTPKMMKAIRMYMDRHKNEKGIIHTSTYKIAEDIRNSIKSPRLLFHNNAGERDSILEKHVGEDRPTILVSPSMITGVDLKYDLARWSIICKVPWPYLGDKRIRKLFEENKNWYSWKSVQDIMQACGRVVRSDDDEAIVYILDEDFARLYGESSHVFPKWWRDALFEDDGN